MPRKRHAGQSQQRTITVFAPVPEQSLDELIHRLHLLRERPSPFSAVSTTHFARLAVLPRNSIRPQPRPTGMHPGARLLDLLTHAGRAQRPDPPSLSYLLFSASYDAIPGSSDDSQYVEQLRVGLGPAADEVWGLCADYPGWSDQAGFVAFFTACSLPPAGYVFSASDDEPTVEQIRRALRLRRRVIDLAVDTDGLADDQLVKQFRQLFDDRADPDDDDPGRQLAGELEAEPVLVDPPAAAERLAGDDRLTGNQRGALTDPDLTDVQNLVTSGYPRHHVSRHLLLRIVDPPAARRWLAVVADAIPTAGWAERYVDRLVAPSDDALPDDPPVERASSPEFAVHLALSYSGLVRLGLAEAELAGFASEFRAGMADREPGLTPGRGISTWRPPFAVPGQRGPDGTTSDPTPAPGVHLLLMFSAVDRDTLAAKFADRPDLLAGADNGLQVLAAFDGGRIKESGSGGQRGKPEFKEHFGFVDGISQPRIHGVTAGRRTAELPAGEVLLGYRDVDGDTAGAGLPAGLARNGSYLVYRRLEQDVPAFRDLTRELAQRLGAKAEEAGRQEPGRQEPGRQETYLRELAAAKLLGRWRDGTPLTLSPDHSDQALIHEPFGFQEQDAEGLRCPIGAHVRRVNPRDSRPVDPDPEVTIGGHAGLEQTLALRHRMLRRGIPYGTTLPEDDGMPVDGIAGDGIAGDGMAGDGMAVDGMAGDGMDERGLLFVALVGDIRRQFEFVQAHWLSDGNAYRLGTDRDILSGAAEQDTKIVVQGDPPTFLRPSKPLVTCRGGEYFFLPGIGALRRIALG